MLTNLMILWPICMSLVFGGPLTVYAMTKRCPDGDRALVNGAMLSLWIAHGLLATFWGMNLYLTLVGKPTLALALAFLAATMHAAVIVAITLDAVSRCRNAKKKHVEPLRPAAVVNSEDNS